MVLSRLSRKGIGIGSIEQMKDNSQSVASMGCLIQQRRFAVRTHEEVVRVAGDLITDLKRG